MSVSDKTNLIGNKCKLPSDYTRILYIENPSLSKNSPFIILDESVSDSFGCYLDVQYLSHKLGWGQIIAGKRLYGSNQSDQFYPLWISDTIKDGKFRIRRGAETVVASDVDFQRHISQLNFLNNRKIIYDNVELKTNLSNFSDRTPGYNFNLFRGCYQNNVGYVLPANGRIYRCVLTRDKIVTRDLVPCIDQKGEACMFDLVTKETFYSATSEKFVAGPRI